MVNSTEQDTLLAKGDQELDQDKEFVSGAKALSVHTKQQSNTNHNKVIIITTMIRIREGGGTDEKNKSNTAMVHG